MAVWGGFLFDEDEALKEQLSGYSVATYSGKPNRNIAVYYRFPDTEETDRTFPHIAIDLVQIEPANERAHRAVEYVYGTPQEQATPPVGSDLVGIDFPLPWNLIYQLATYARLPRDDRQLQSLLTMMFPNQFGSVVVTADGTVRRADYVSSVRRDTVDQDQKRLYRVIFTIRVSSEFPLGQLYYVQQNTEIDVSFTPSRNGTVGAIETMVVP